eukprot:3980972-Pyramimonas_sp.AAC.1
MTSSHWSGTRSGDHQRITHQRVQESGKWTTAHAKAYIPPPCMMYANHFVCEIVGRLLERAGCHPAVL